MSDEKKAPKPPAPLWAWLFVIPCVLIPIVTVGGAIPGAIGGGGAYTCYAIARDDSKSIGARLMICVAVTALCWLLSFLLVGGALFFGGA